MGGWFGGEELHSCSPLTSPPFRPEEDEEEDEEKAKAQGWKHKGRCEHNMAAALLPTATSTLGVKSHSVAAALTRWSGGGGYGEWGVFSQLSLS